MEPRVRQLLRAALLGVLVAGMLAASSPVGTAASADVTVATNVLSSTTLIPTNCAADTAGRTNLGVVMPGFDAIGTLGCELQFGSSNDTGRLLMHQTDLHGSPMYYGYTGAIDTSLGDAGFLHESVGTGADRYRDAIQLPDARGYLLVGSITNANTDVLVEHRDADWQLVPGWGTEGNGRTIIDAGTSPAPTKIQVDSKDRIVITGSHGSRALAIRLLADGTPDLDFATAGVFNNPAFNLGGGSPGSVLADDRIMWVYSVTPGGLDNWDLIVVIADENGVPDVNVGGGDGIVDPWHSGVWHDKAHDIEPAPDGGAYILFHVQNCGANARILKVDSLGEVDTGWANLGQTNDTYPSCAVLPSDLIVTDDGKLLMGGYTNDTSIWWIARRHLTSGALDTTFNGSGRRGGGLGGNKHEGARLMLTDEQTISLAFADVATIWAVRTNSTGQLDGQAGEGMGRTRIDHPSASVVTVGAIVPGIDGEAYLVGSATIGGDEQLLTIRLPGDTIPEYATAPDRRFGSTTSAAFGACLLNLTDAGEGPPWSPRGVGGCTESDDPGWHTIAADTPDPGALLATADPNTDTATATIVFGLHTLTSTRPGSVWAPVTFSVLAP